MKPRKAVVGWWMVLLLTIHLRLAIGQIHPSDETPVENVHVLCNSDNIVVTLHASADFNGLIYPKGLARNSTCMAAYNDVRGNISYAVPLHSCNTMSSDVNDGVEYFNTVVVQPHRRLVTNQGRGFHVRCRYHTKDRIVQNDVGVNMSDLNAVPYDMENEIPSSAMKIYIGEDDRQLHQAENVRIGDQLRMIVTLEKQSAYGMKVTNCLVRDGLNWGEQQLINHHGCSVDKELMGELSYSDDKTSATVRFQAHKFPYTSSVYYQCTVQLCTKKDDGCEDVPPLCTADGRNLRRKRQARPTTVVDIAEDVYSNDTRSPDDLSVSVYSGIRVNDAETGPVDDQPKAEEKKDDESAFCISTRIFAIIIAVIGLLLMAAVILLVVCLIQRRRRRKDLGTTAGSSIYSGPYSNHAYSST